MARNLLIFAGFIGLACTQSNPGNYRSDNARALNLNIKKSDQFQSDEKNIDYVYPCKGKRERLPVEGSCDRYIECVNGQPKELTCPDGLFFDPDVKFHIYPCKYPIDVECNSPAAIQRAQPTDDCPHQFGYYKLGDAKNCSYFRNCVSGVAYDLTCPEGLAFNPNTYKCDWPDQVPECDADAFLGFKCPEVIDSPFGPPSGYRSYKNDQDCQKFFTCVDNRPRIAHCGYGHAFDEEVGACLPLTEVLACPEELRLKFAEEEYERTSTSKYNDSNE